MRLEPVFAVPDDALDAVAEAIGERLTLRDELDVDVYRASRDGRQPDLVVRAFGSSLGRPPVDTVVEVLENLAPTKYPAETLAGPVVEHDGACLLVTQFVESSPPPIRGFALAWCAGLLGHLAMRNGAGLPPGGGWHRLATTPGAEIEAALALALPAELNEVRDALADCDDAAGLPEALIHPDLTPANLVTRGDERPVVIDWMGTGRGPRVWPLAYLLMTAGPRGAARGLERYQRTITLTDEELERLPGLLLTRPLALDLWSAAHELISPREAVGRFRRLRANAANVTAALRGMH